MNMEAFVVIVLCVITAVISGWLCVNDEDQD